MTVKLAATRINMAGTTGNIDISAGAGFGTPKGAIFIANATTTDNTAQDNAKISMGFTDGVRDRCVLYSVNNGGGSTIGRRGIKNLCYSLQSGGGTIQHEASFVSWITDGIRINQTSATTTWFLTVIFIGGDEPQVYVGTLTNNGSISGTTAVTDPGFTPHTIFFLGAGTTSTGTTDGLIAFGCADRVGGVTTQRSNAVFDLHGADTTSIGAYFSNAHACKVCSETAAGVGIDITSFDANGYTSTTRDVATSVQWPYMAVTWGTRSHALSTVFSPTSTGASAQTWPNFRPQGLIGSQALVGSQNSHVSNQNAGGFAAAVITQAASYCVSINDQDNVGTTNTQTLNDDTAVRLPDEAGATLLVASLQSLDSTGYTLDYTSVSGSGRAGWFFALQGEQDIVPKVRYRRRQMGVA